MKPVTRARVVFDWIAGVLLIVLGIAGLFLPVLQGVLFILAGLAILSSHSKLARRAQDALKTVVARLRERFARRP